MGLPWMCINFGCKAEFDDGVEPLDRKCPFCGSLVVRRGPPPEEGSNTVRGTENIV